MQVVRISLTPSLPGSTSAFAGTLLQHGTQLLETCALLPRLRIILRTYLTCGKSCIQTLPVLLFPWQQDIIAQTRRESTGLTVNSANHKAYTCMRAQQ